MGTDLQKGRRLRGLNLLRAAGLVFLLRQGQGGAHRFSLEHGARGYDMFKHKKDGCVRAVFAP